MGDFYSALNYRPRISSGGIVDSAHSDWGINDRFNPNMKSLVNEVLEDYGFFKGKRRAAAGADVNKIDYIPGIQQIQQRKPDIEDLANTLDVIREDNYKFSHPYHPLLSPAKGTFPTASAQVPTPSLSPTTKGLQQHNLTQTPLTAKPGPKQKITIGSIQAPPLIEVKEKTFLKDRTSSSIKTEVHPDEVENMKNLLFFMPAYKEYADKNVGKTVYPLFVRDITGDKESRIHNMAEFSEKNIAKFLAKMAGGELKDVKFKLSSGRNTTYTNYDTAAHTIMDEVEEAAKHGRTYVIDIHGRKFEIYRKPFPLTQKFI